jgi:hypothetical protein
VVVAVAAVAAAVLAGAAVMGGCWMMSAATLAVPVCVRVGRDPKKAGPEALAWLSGYLQEFQDALEAPDWLRQVRLAPFPLLAAFACCCSCCLLRGWIAAELRSCTAPCSCLMPPIPCPLPCLPAHPPFLQPLPLLHRPHRRPLLGRLLPAHRGHQESRWVPVSGRGALHACRACWKAHSASGTARLY